MENNPNDELNKVENLKTRLFSKSYQTRIEDREGYHFIKRDKIAQDWDNTDLGDFKSKPIKLSPIFKNFFLFSFILFLGALGYLGYNLFLKTDNISNENIEIAVLGNTFTGGGEELPLIVEVTNNNALPLELADLVIQYPKGSAVDINGEEIERLRKSLGVIKGGEVKSENIKVALFGETGSIHQIKIALEYRIEGSNAIFIKDKLYEVTINSTPVNLVFEGPSDATPEQVFTLKIKASLNENTKTANDLVAKLDYPFGFEFISANPSPSLSNNVWDLEGLVPGKELEISVTGRMIDVFDGEEKIFHVFSGPEKKGDKGELGVTFNSLAHSLLIKKPFIETKLFVNNEYKKEYSVTSKDSIIGIVHWTNNLDSEVKDLEITAKFSGNIFNPKNVDFKEGFFDSKTNTIIWDKNTNEGYDSVLPRGKGAATFVISPGSLFALNGDLLLEPTLDVQISLRGKQAQAGNILKNLDVIENKKIKIISDITLLGKSAYAGGPFKNTGPYPSIPEKETTYTITFGLANTINNISKAKMITTLPARVTYKNLVSPNNEKVTFNEDTRELVWDIGNIAREAGLKGNKKEVAIQVSYTPSLSEVGLNPTLVNKSILTGYDDFANVEVKAEKGVLTMGSNIKEE